MKSWLQGYNAETYSTYSGSKSVTAEIFARTLIKLQAYGFNIKKCVY